MNTPSAQTNLPSPRTKCMLYVGWVIVIAGCSTVAALVYRAVLDAKHDEECRTNLQRIGVALEHYHERFGSFPPAYVLNEQGQRWHSWRVLLLPDLGHADLYGQYRFGEPWNGPHNRQLMTRMPAVYGCPADSKRAEGIANYFAIVGPQAVWPEHCALRIGQITDGTSNTASVIESVDTGIAWLEPRDLNYAELKDGGYHSNPGRSLKHTEQMRFLLADGSVRSVARDLKEKVFRSLCTPDGGRPFPGVNWQLPVAESAEIQTVPRPSREMPNTTVLPYLNSALVAGRNAVYCATFQLAWDRLREDVIRAPVELAGSPEMVRELNRRAFPRDSLAEDARVAMAGQLSHGILDEIQSQMKAKFPLATPRLVPRIEGIGLVAYAYLQKRLPFATSFDYLEHPLRFHAADGETEVVSFGIEDFGSHDPREKSLRQQVTVLDYVGHDDFVLQLNTQKDKIVLAKIPRVATLAEALATVQARSAQPLGRHVQKQLDIEEPLVIPLLSLFVDRQYTELIGRSILNPGFTLQQVVDARQLIRFQLDESGAILESEAAVITMNGDEPPPAPRRFVFDRPFLIYLHERQAKLPYFVMWVENAEVLVCDARRHDAASPADKRKPSR